MNKIIFYRKIRFPKEVSLMQHNKKYYDEFPKKDNINFLQQHS